MFKKLVVGALAAGIALTGGIGAASASTEGVDNIKNSAPIIRRTQIIKDDFSLINRERELSFEHVKKADMRVHMTNNTKGTLDWSLKDSKGNVIGKEERVLQIRTILFQKVNISLKLLAEMVVLDHSMQLLVL
ncbi:LCI family antimicrobial peptide [Bacillus toyonensis]|uniref:LCI family antimicrobial peptide n=1 Tax=Bacillus toyonensis TaxID=155322 RepID=UPI0022B7A257|nr:LCI family antimicrobial peptide [Bacillus toyonensis]